MKKNILIPILVVFIASQFNIYGFANDIDSNIYQNYGRPQTRLFELYTDDDNDEFINDSIVTSKGKGNIKKTSGNNGKGNNYGKRIGQANFTPPGLANKGYGKSVVVPKKNNRGQGKGKKKGNYSFAWTGELLEDVEPIVVSEYYLNKYGVAESEVELFEQSFPSILPIESTYITSGYGRRKNPTGKGNDFHEGVDLKANYQNVWATGSGIVSFAGYKKYLGYSVIIDHGFGFETIYAHNSKVLVTEGETIERYHVIALSGDSGNSTGPHLHYEIIYEGTNLDPIEVIYDRTGME